MRKGDMTSSRHRLRRIFKWAGMLVCILLLASAIVSLVASFDVGIPTGPVETHISVQCCCLIAYFFIPPSTPINGKLQQPIWFLRTNWSHATPVWLPEYRRYKTSSDLLIVPLWIPFVTTAIPTFIFWRRDRRYPPGHCVDCGYNLTGNVSGRCPECGKAT